MPLIGTRWHGLAIVIMLLVLGGVSACTVGSRQDELPVQASSPASIAEVQSPQTLPARVTLRNGTTINCPSGAIPTIYVERASFGPLLNGGTRLGRAKYRIAVDGRVVNETDAPVRITALEFKVGAKPWRATISSPTQLGPGDSQPFVARGAFHSARDQQAKVSAQLGWRWQDAKLLPCGHKGLIEDS